MLSRVLARLSADYLAAYGHRVLTVEPFTDPARYTGACYAAANVAQVGSTLGYSRIAATEPPNITVQVLPRDVGGSPGLEGPFTLLTLSASIPDIVHTESPAGGLYVEDRDQVRQWTLRFGT